MRSFVKTLCISHLHVQYIVGHSVYFCRVSVVFVINVITNLYLVLLPVVYILS